MGIVQKLARGNGLIIYTAIFIVFNITNIPFLFHLILDYSTTKLWLYIAHCLVILVAFIPVIYGFREVLHSLADYRGIDSHLNAYVWANLGFFIFTGLVVLGYWADIVSGWMAILVGILVSSVVYLLIPILAIIMGAKLKECQHDLYGLREPIRLSILWYGVLCLSFFLSEIAIIATWFNDILLLMLFLKFKKQQEKRASDIETSRFSKSKIWGFFAIAVFVSVANYASLFAMPTDRVSLFEWFFGSDDESSEDEYEFDDYDLPILSSAALNERLSLKSVYSKPDTHHIIGDHIWLGHHRYLQFSSDRGNSFSLITSPLEHGIEFVQFDAESVKGVVANDWGELAITFNGGTNWKKIDLVEIVGTREDGDSPSVRNFVFSENMSKAYFVADCDLWTNSNGFDQWEKLSVESDGDSQCIDQVFLEPDGALAWAKITQFGFDHTTHFWRTFDEGKTWKEICSYYSQFITETNKSRHCETIESELPELSDSSVIKQLKVVEELSSAAERNLPLNVDFKHFEQTFGYFNYDKKHNRLWYIKDGLKYTEDLGKSWHNDTNWFDYGSDILWANDNGFALATSDCQLWKTENYGKLWEVISHDSNDQCIIFELNFETDKTLFLVSSAELVSIEKSDFNITRLVNLEGEDDYIRTVEKSADNELLILLRGDLPAMFSSDLGSSWHNSEERFDFRYVKCFQSCWGIKNNKLYKISLIGKQLASEEVASLQLSRAIEYFYEPHNEVFLNFSSDEQTGWLITNAGEVLSTNNGGQDWQSEAELPEAYYHTYLREELNEIWVVNEGEKLWQINMLDGTRQEIQLGDLGRISKHCFNIEKSIYIITGSDGSAISFDSGETWQDPQIGYDSCYLGSEYLWMSERVYSVRR